MNFTEEELHAFCKWLKKVSGCKKRFFYRKKLTKFGAVAVVFGLCTYSIHFFQSLRGGLNA